ncbi:Cro/Cl family transcriptional regulator [Neisseria sp. KEM232]|uniref:XRE family transcriptional regulator n=1 Tax=Neisseria sp. KEM232 TaxID=655307 RepID=UPI000B8C4DD5|nr:S24 family peptidase [Neisseria sp. KEM232]ASP16782.1 Cro/Cl family transcriptional regulator [Neisseria sp. KEM232]
METLAERINTALQTKGLSVNALARQVGVSYPAMRKITKGETLNPKFLFEIAEALNVSVEWLKTGEGPSENLSDGLADDRIRFERLDVIASLGDGYVNNETAEVVDFVHVDKAWARENLGGNLSRIQVITARGDSMQGTIEDGDVLFVDTSVRWFEGEGVYLLSFADGLKAKRLQASVGGGLLVISDNPLYRTETVEDDKLEKLTICGRVRGAWHLSTL